MAFLGIGLDPRDLGFEILDDLAAAGLPFGEEGDHLGEGLGLHVAQGCDGGDVDGGWGGCWGEAGGDEVCVDGSCDEAFEVGR